MLSKIIAKYPKYSKLRLRQTVVTKQKNYGKQTVEILFSYPTRLNSADRIAIENCVNEFMPSKYYSLVGYEIDAFDADVFVNKSISYCLEAFPTLAHRLNGNVSASITDDVCTIVFHVDDITAGGLERFHVIDKLSEFFAEYTCHNVAFEIDRHPLEQTLDEMLELSEQYLQLQINRQLSKPKRFLSVTDVTEYIGKIVNSKPRYIKDIQTAQTTVTVCGKVHDTKLIKTFEKNPDKTIKNPENPREIIFLVFNLVDYTGSIAAKFFPNKDSITKMEKIANGDEIIVQGQTKYDDKGQLQLTAKSISRCRILAETEQPKNAKPIPAQFVVVKPKRITVQKQASLDEAVSEPPKYFSQHNVVCLNVETTGNNVRLDKIIKINAVKIVHGTIKESFSSFINPEMQVAPEQLKELGITEKSLSEKPSIIDVIPDLYKFAAESTLIVHNADVSLSFVKFYAFASDYDFKYPTYDIIDLAVKELSTKDQSAVRLAYNNMQLLAEKVGVEQPETVKDKSVLIAQMLMKLLSTNDKLFENT